MTWENGGPRTADETGDEKLIRELNAEITHLKELIFRVESQPPISPEDKDEIEAIVDRVLEDADL